MSIYHLSKTKLILKKTLDISKTTYTKKIKIETFFGGQSPLKKKQIKKQTNKKRDMDNLNNWQR